MSKNLLDIIKKNGYAFVPNFFSSTEVNSLKKELISIYSKYKIGDQIEIPGIVSSNQYSTGKSMRIYPAAYNLFPEIKNFKQDWLYELVDQFFEGANNKGLQVFSSYETLAQQDVKELPRNSYMHVDPYHSLKFFSYLTDTSKENGALQVIPGTNWIGKMIREKNNINDLLGSDLYTFKKSQYYNSDIENKTIHIEGKAGDMIILNTDVMHCGGVILKPGLERLSIIYHNRK